MVRWALLEDTRIQAQANWVQVRDLPNQQM